eukprot:178652_1
MASAAIQEHCNQTQISLKEIIKELKKLKDTTYQNINQQLTKYIINKNDNNEKYYIEQLVHQIIFNALLKSYNTMKKHKENQQVKQMLPVDEIVKDLLNEKYSAYLHDMKSKLGTKKRRTYTYEHKVENEFNGLLKIVDKQNNQYFCEFEDGNSKWMVLPDNLKQVMEYEKFIKGHDIYDDIYDSLDEYIMECCKICNNMLLHNPPLHFVSSEWESKDEIYDHIKHVRKELGSDLKCNKILYYIWPAIAQNDCILKGQKMEVITRDVMYKQGYALKDLQIFNTQLTQYKTQEKDAEIKLLHQMNVNDICGDISIWIVNDVKYNRDIKKIKRLFVKKALNGKRINNLDADHVQSIVQKELQSLMTIKSIHIVFEYFDRWKDNPDELRSISAQDIAVIVYNYPLYNLLQKIQQRDITGSKFVQHPDYVRQFIATCTGWHQIEIHQIEVVLFQKFSITKDQFKNKLQRILSPPATKQLYKYKYKYFQILSNDVINIIKTTMRDFFVDTVYYQIKNGLKVEDFSDQIINMIDDEVQNNEQKKISNNK